MLMGASGQDFPVVTIDRNIDFKFESASIPHLHHGLEIKILGNFDAPEQGGVQSWKAGQAMIVLPEVIHLSFNKEEAQRSISILLEDNRISCVCCAEMLPETIPTANLAAFGVNVSGVSRFLHSQGERKRQSRYSGRHAIMILKSLMTALVLHIEAGEDSEAELSPVVKAVNYIRRHYYHNELSVEDIAAHVGMTPNHLVGLFRRKMGVTLRQYLIRTRLEQGKMLLADGCCFVRDAARLTGWSSAYYFSNCYREYFGVPPSKTRLASDLKTTRPPSTPGGSPSAREIHGADQTVSVPGNAKRLSRDPNETRDLRRLGLKNVRKDFRQASTGSPASW
jgi:AraC-like DNA-binding protein